MAKKIKKEKAEGTVENKATETTDVQPVKESKPKKSKKVKKAPKKETTKKKETKERNEYGHAEGTQSAIIDEMLRKGSDLQTMAEKVGSSKGRVKSHIKHLEKDHGAKIKEKDGVYKLSQSK